MFTPISVPPRLRSIHVLLCAVAGLLLVSFAGGVASAQTSSSITGSVQSQDGQALPGAEVIAESASFSRSAVSDTDGRYRLPALPAGTYTITVTADGFATSVRRDLELLLNSDVTVDFNLEVGTVNDVVTVTGSPALLDVSSSDTGSVVTPRQIETLPVNGRDYLDLMQLVPGVQISREKDQGSDEAAPILGERAGNAIFLIDGMPNRDEFGSGVASQYTQDTIQEFEVITGGFKAEFGHGSGGVINVVTKGGTNQFRGMALGFFRDDSLDSSNSLDPDTPDPELSRENFAFTLGGPVVQDKVFAFGSAEIIDEDRVLNFSFPPATPDSLRTFEAGFDEPNVTEEDRYFLKFNEQVGDRHSFDQQISYNEATISDFLPLSMGDSLPSARDSFERERTMFGLRQTSLIGDVPWIFEGHIQYRDHFDSTAPSHPEAGVATAFNIFSSPFTFGVFGDLGSVSFGNPTTPSAFDQEYIAIGPSFSGLYGNHEVKFGIEYLNTQVDGMESSLVNNQLFATADNFARFGPVFSGLFTLTEIGPRTAEGAAINLRQRLSRLLRTRRLGDRQQPGTQPRRPLRP